MGRKKKIHKPLDHTFDEVIEAVAKGKGTRQPNKDTKKRSEKKESNSK